LGATLLPALAGWPEQAAIERSVITAGSVSTLNEIFICLPELDPGIEKRVRVPDEA